MCPECVRLSTFRKEIVKGSKESQGTGCLCFGVLITLITLIIMPVVSIISPELGPGIIVSTIFGLIVGIGFILMGICMNYSK